MRLVCWDWHQPTGGQSIKAKKKKILDFPFHALSNWKQPLHKIHKILLHFINEKRSNHFSLARNSTSETERNKSILKDIVMSRLTRLTMLPIYSECACIEETNFCVLFVLFCWDSLTC